MMKKPLNVLWICTDQQRWDTLGCNGQSWVHTPHIDSLAARGVNFEHAYCQNPTCTPSRASFLTSRYPSTNRDRRNGQNMPAGELLVTRVLADAGYRCGLSGKLHISACNPSVTQEMEPRIDDGYEVFHWSHGPQVENSGNAYLNWLKQKGVKYETPFMEGMKHVRVGMPAELHQTTWCADRAIEFIEEGAQNPERPWLFSLNIFDPHQPFDAPLSHLQRYMDRIDQIPLPDYVPGELEHTTQWQRKDHQLNIRYTYDDISDCEHRMLKASYWAMVDLIDEQVGRVLEALRRTGQDKNTLVIFMSDHGEMLGDHGIYLKGAYFYQPLARVPLVIAGPGVQQRGRSGALIELLDIAPTLLEMAGVDKPPTMQGRSFWKLLTEGNAPDQHRKDIYCEYHYGAAVNGENDPMCTMLFDGRHKLTISHNEPVEGELYDLQADPNEHRNLWADPQHAQIKACLMLRLCNRMAYTVDPLPAVIAPW